MLLRVAAVLKICGVKVAPFLRGNMRKPAASDASVGGLSEAENLASEMCDIPSLETNVASCGT